MLVSVRWKAGPSLILVPFEIKSFMVLLNKGHPLDFRFYPI